MNRLSRVSIIVPTKNEAANLPLLIASIPPQPELIICDSSSDETADLALRLRPENTRILRVDGGIAEARQIGAEAATGDTLVFTDADVTFGFRYFTRLMAQKKWDVIYGVKLSATREFRFYYSLVASSQWLAHTFLGVAAASGSNMVIRRSAFRELGGFRLDLPCNEDSELVFRAYHSGFSIRFRRSLKVHAQDHRRLYRGRWTKSLHSLTRNALLYSMCLRPQTPDVLKDDWGYWSVPR